MPDDDAELASDDYGGLSEVIDQAVTHPTKTPFYQASNALRYQRQAIIKTIQERSGRHLMCYVSGSGCSIDRDDTIGFVDLLHNIPEGEDLDLLLHTGGGDIDAAEKLVKLVRTRVGTATLRVVVPDFAKSAGTLMALGADHIVMSDMSELGPVDPQIVLADADGNRIRYSVQSHLDAYEAHTQALAKRPDDVAARIMLSKLDPVRITFFQAARDRARKIAEDLLKQGMFQQGGGNFTLTAAALLDTKRWLSHGQMISWQDATDPGLGLSVEYMASDDELWQQYWQLYCLQRLAVGDRQKLYESAYASLVLDAPQR